MSIYTKLIFAAIWLGCVICIMNLAEFIGLAFGIFIVYLLLRFVIPLVAVKGDGARGNSNAKTVG